MSLAKASILKDYIRNHPAEFGKVVDFTPQQDRLITFDFTAGNESLSPEIIADTGRFSDWVNEQLSLSDSRYGVGGYNEHRTLYARSSHFDTLSEARRLHLGVDIWGPAGTPVYNPMDGYVHSFQFNDHFGDYGATIILVHQLGNLRLHTLYGHLSLASLEGLKEGQFVPKGKKFAEFGIPEENGHWPPHLHFQLIFDLQDMRGDYPGVCCYSEKEHYLENCPDPNDILRFTF
jgi:peptidoglycan LD-endopeptidase LytH